MFIYNIFIAGLWLTPPTFQPDGISQYNSPMWAWCRAWRESRYSEVPKGIFDSPVVSGAVGVAAPHARLFVWHPSRAVARPRVRLRLLPRLCRPPRVATSARLRRRVNVVCVATVFLTNSTHNTSTQLNKKCTVIVALVLLSIWSPLSKLSLCVCINNNTSVKCQPRSRQATPMSCAHL